ncbi:transposase [Streptomyces sp. IB201691-2A2]|uniref:transposase n=1 Tax=Streptomyces sp. IB201691-2A2 TaxID=2561920 RepID=UPI0011801F40|nr:hypothetical protein E4K73_50785 [Streptomyces sp. IB201691-2A2]
MLESGPIAAVQILVSWPHKGRFHPEASFAGVSPIPASSGMTTNRLCLNRGGDRQVNRARPTVEERAQET